MDIIPVPVYYPEVKEILGKPVVRDLRQIQGHLDILDVFRRPADLPQVTGQQTNLPAAVAASRTSCEGHYMAQTRAGSIHWLR
jgi:predicted CoA-binding protein